MSGGVAEWVRALVAFGLLLELGVLLVLLGLWVRERAALARFVRDAEQGEPSEERLPARLREAADALIPTLKSSATVDSGLCWAVLAIGRAPLAPSALMSLLVDLGLALIAAMPMTLALAHAAQKLAGLPVVSANDVRTYLAVVSDVPQAFSALRSGFGGSAVLLSGLAAVISARIGFFGHSARDYRARAAFVGAVLRGRPEAKVAESKRTLEVLADRRSFVIPATSTVVFLFMSGAGAAVLSAATPIRLENVHRLSYTRWPTDRVVAAGVTAPHAPAGAPLTPGTSLVIAPQQVSFGGRPLVDLSDGRLEPGWEGRVLPSPVAVGTSSTLVLSDGLLPLATVFALMHYLDRTHHLRDYGLVVERHLPSTKHPVAQATLSLRLPDNNQPDVTLTIDEEQVKVGSENISFLSKSWMHSLRASMRDVLRLDEATTKQLYVGLRVAPEVTVERLTEVLGTADGMCEVGEDCGLPGLGIHFVVLD